jgi:large subunit ribosomal protein L29
MELDKIRNFSDAELKQQEGQAAEQLFRLRFNAKLGQTEGIKKLRELKRDVARFKTIARQRELGLTETGATKAAQPAAETKAAKKSAKTKKESR